MITRKERATIPHESDIEFEYKNAIGLNDRRSLKRLIRKKWPLPKCILRYAYMISHDGLFPILLDAGADPNYEDGPWTIMGDCIVKRKISTLKVLLAHGANPNLGFNGAPAIVLAARVGNVEILRLLVEAGAKLAEHPHTAAPALFEAVGRGHKEIVQFLIERGVKFTSRKPFGKTALEFAEENGRTEIRDILRQYKNKKAKRRTRNISASKRIK